MHLVIYYKAGFLRADRQLGVAAVKLANLETRATIHESVDVFENDHRKKAQGKLEVKIRIREALGPSKAADLTSQRWLVIDRFDDTVSLPIDRLSSSRFAFSPKPNDPLYQSKSVERPFCLFRFFFCFHA